MTEKTRQRKSATPKVETEEVTDTKSNIDEVITVKLDELNAEMTKRYGSGMVKKELLPKARHVPTGSFDIDLRTLGGLVDCRLNQIKGFESTGKTTLAMAVIKAAQLKYPDKTAIFMDTETHLDPDWLDAQDVDHTKLQNIVGLEYAEAYAEVFDSLLKTGECSIIVLDSIASMTTSDDLEKNAEENTKVSGIANVVGRMCSSIIAAFQYCSNNGIHFPMIIFINQYRDKVGARVINGVIPKTDNGGHQKNFTSSIILELARPRNIEWPDPITGDKRTFMDEQAFKLIKAKTGSYAKKGEIKKVVSNAHPRLQIGSYDEVAKVVKYAKKLGLVSPLNGPKRVIATLPDALFGNDKDMAMGLEADKVAMDLCKACIVAITRKNMGKPMVPFDDYLMGFNSKQINEVIERAEANVKANEK